MKEGDYINLKQASEQEFDQCVKAANNEGFQLGWLLRSYGFSGLERFFYYGLVICEGRIWYFEGDGDTDAENELSLSEWIKGSEA